MTRSIDRINAGLFVACVIVCVTGYVSAAKLRPTHAAIDEAQRFYTPAPREQRPFCLVTDIGIDDAGNFVALGSYFTPCVDVDTGKDT